MTLIISVLTKEYVALVSDRRITWQAGNVIKRQEDTDIKTFILNGQLIMGFTGLARIGGVRMEKWVFDVLGGVPANEYLPTLTKEIGSAFRKYRHVGKLPHAFLGVGYSDVYPNGQPLGAIITNCTVQDETSEQPEFSTTKLASEFSLYAESLGNRRAIIRSVGHPVRSSTMQALQHRVRVVTKGDPSNPRLAMGPLVTALRSTARHSRGFVGDAALFSSMPHRAVSHPGVSIGNEVDFRTTSAALFLPGEERGFDNAVMYGPASISPHMSFAGIRVYAGTPSTPLGGEEGWGQEWGRGSAKS